LAPWLAGVIAVQYSLHIAILGISVTTWLACALLFGATAVFIPRDIERLREEMRMRAMQEQRLEPGVDVLPTGPEIVPYS
jgi:hypothetical protein